MTHYSPITPLKQLANSVTTTFAPLFDRLMVHEGGYVNHPNDPGGETNWGITKRVARQYGYRGDMSQLPKATAYRIAKQLYWEAIHGGKLDKSVAWQLMDAAFHHGNLNAVKMLQRAIGVKDDGIIGNITLAAVATMDKNDVLLRFNAERLEFFVRLRTFTTFGRGWTRRVAGNLRFAAKDN